MSSQTAMILRFPSGFAEISYASEAPKVGDILKRGNESWEVFAVEGVEDACIVVTLGAQHARNGLREQRKPEPVGV